MQSFCFWQQKQKGFPLQSGLIHKTMSKEKGVYTGKIEQDEHGNFFCGAYLLDYQMASKFKLGDEVNLKTVIENPSDKSYNLYPKKTFLQNQKILCKCHTCF